MNASDFYTLGDSVPILVDLPALDGAGVAVVLTSGVSSVKGRLVKYDRSAFLTPQKTIASSDPGCNFAALRVALTMVGSDTSSLTEQKAVVEIQVAFATGEETFWSAPFWLRKGYVS
jgi:hypothetical protein